MISMILYSELHKKILICKVKIAEIMILAQMKRE